MKLSYAETYGEVEDTLDLATVPTPTLGVVLPDTIEPRRLSTASSQTVNRIVKDGQVWFHLTDLLILSSYLPFYDTSLFLFLVMLQKRNSVKLDSNLER